MIRVIVDRENITLTANGDGFTLISEAGTLVETLLTDIAKDGPDPKANFIELVDMFCYVLVKHAKETD